MNRDLCDRIAELPSNEQRIVMKLVEVLMKSEPGIATGSQDEPADVASDESPAAVAGSEAPQPDSDST